MAKAQFQTFFQRIINKEASKCHWVLYRLVPRLSCVGRQKRAWYTLSVHAQFLQDFWEFGTFCKICSVTLTSARHADFSRLKEACYWPHSVWTTSKEQWRHSGGGRAWYTLFVHVPSSLGNLHTTPLHWNYGQYVYRLKSCTAWIIILPVRHTGGFEIRNNIALTLAVCIASFEAISELQRKSLHRSCATAFS